MDSNPSKEYVTYEQEYPRAYRTQIYEILCPMCNKWCKEYGMTNYKSGSQFVQLVRYDNA